VARLAATFAAPFCSSPHGKLEGEVHDLGKARSSFQSYLRRCNGVEDDEPDFGDHAHSGAGACWLALHGGGIGKALAYCVAGHHAGLPDWSGGDTPNGALAIRLKEDAAVLLEPPVREWIASHEVGWLRERLTKPLQFSRDDSSLPFWIRMMYSCLVDADFLDTEAFMDPAQSAKRSFGQPLSALANAFFAYLDEKQRTATDTDVNRIRAGIRAACEQAAELPPGLFSLTVPTGGGKTLSGTAFAFRHALRHGLKRIIYVIPYTSIIEQTADVLRGILGPDNVLEHHSNFDPDKETRQSRLASENWDAPVIVTTSVQFFESLYACKSSRCRKLHNIAESVVILDEVQLLPSKLLLPCAEAIRQLASHYRVSFVLSTATQLNLPGIDPASIREIAPPSLDLYHRLKRVRIEFPADRNARKSWDEIAAELCGHERVLCVVNTRRDCRVLFDKMPGGTIHLSASMCGAHRSRVIGKIKRKLADGEPVRVISTQLVEAGVDIDFPVVYRAFTGLASIAQSAGRCNREGLLPELGRVVVFMPPEPSPKGELLQGEYTMFDLLDRPGGIDPEDENTFPDYFRALHHRMQNLGIEFESWLGVPVPQAFRNGTTSSIAEPMHYQFREAAGAFQMIDGSAQVAVIVRYDDSDALISSLRAVGPKSDIMRRLQRYIVNVPRKKLSELIEKGLVEELRVPPKPDTPSGIFVQTMPSAYSERFGLDLFRDGLSVEDNIA
jgi:CRISPR-associated endonuclease/helicase Cas3